MKLHTLARIALVFRWIANLADAIAEALEPLPPMPPLTPEDKDA